MVVDYDFGELKWIREPDVVGKSGVMNFENSMRISDGISHI